MEGEYKNTTQSRKWNIVINNPQLCDLSHEKIIEILHRFNPDYFCLSDEIGKTGNYHTHIFLYSESPIRFGTVKNRFPTAHIEKAIGLCFENRDYIAKTGKWLGSPKAATQVENSFYEYGDIPSAEEEKNPKMYRLYQNIKDGYSTSEIIESNPSFCLQGPKIDQLRDMIESEKYKTELRKVLQVSYLFGASGTGKTRSIFEKHPITDICRITDYGGIGGVRFDAYHSQPILVFEEFASQIPIQSMLNYLDIYPVWLPARYQDRVACYTTVYITSNMPFDDQYIEVQKKNPEIWKAFMRRVHTIIRYNEDGSTLCLKG